MSGSRAAVVSSTDVRELLERSLATVKSGPDMGWTHPDEALDYLCRHVQYAIDDLAQGDEELARAVAEVALMRRVMEAAGTWDQFRHDYAAFKIGYSVLGGDDTPDAKAAQSANADAPVRDWHEYVCAHDHRWWSAPTSTRCPVCNTSTYKPVAIANVRDGVALPGALPVPGGDETKALRAVAAELHGLGQWLDGFARNAPMHVPVSRLDRARALLDEALTRVAGLEAQAAGAIQQREEYVQRVLARTAPAENEAVRATLRRCDETFASIQLSSQPGDNTRNLTPVRRDIAEALRAWQVRGEELS